MPLNVMSISKNYKQISITRLILNPENDRFELVENEKLALETMLNKLGSKIYVLALDIVKRGLSPKPFYVVPYYNKYIVKDGNRRTTAIKLLARPKLIDEKKYPSLRIKFEKLHSKYIQNPIKSILCYIYSDNLDADNWVELEHTGEQKGVGTVEWGSEQIHRFNKKHGKNPPIQIQAMDFIRHSVFISDEIKTMSENIRLTNFERLINDKDVRKLLGLSWLNSQLVSGIEEVEVAKALSAVISKMAEPHFKVKSIYTSTDRMSFIEKMSSDLPDLSKSTTPWSLNDWNSVSNSSEESEDLSNGEEDIPITSEDADSNELHSNKGHNHKNSPIPYKRKTIIPSKLVIRITNPKVNKIYNELQKLDIYKYPNCAAITFRVFIELSIDTYLEEKSLLGEGKISAAKSGKQMPEKVSIVRNHLKQKGVTDDAISKAIGTMMKNEDSLLGLSTFHAYVHNNRFAAIPEDIVTTWDNIQDFMVTLWAQIEMD